MKKTIILLLASMTLNLHASFMNIDDVNNWKKQNGQSPFYSESNRGKEKNKSKDKDSKDKDSKDKDSKDKDSKEHSYEIPDNPCLTVPEIESAFMAYLLAFFGVSHRNRYK